MKIDAENDLYIFLILLIGKLSLILCFIRNTKIILIIEIFQNNRVEFFQFIFFLLETYSHL